jgi:hypothetical protein
MILRNAAAHIMQQFQIFAGCADFVGQAIRLPPVERSSPLHEARAGDSPV